MGSYAKLQVCLCLRSLRKVFDPCFDSRDAKVVKVSGSRDARKDSSPVSEDKVLVGWREGEVMVGCRLKNWRGSATSNAGTPVSAARKSRGFKLEERKRNKRMEVSIEHAHFL
jgi:hypothetical protein